MPEAPRAYKPCPHCGARFFASLAPSVCLLCNKPMDLAPARPAKPKPSAPRRTGLTATQTATLALLRTTLRQARRR